MSCRFIQWLKGVMGHFGDRGIAVAASSLFADGVSVSWAAQEAPRLGNCNRWMESCGSEVHLAVP